MTWERIEGSWHQFRDRVKRRWARLTERELDRINGRREELQRFLQQAYGLEVDDACQQIDEFCRRSDTEVAA